MKLVLVEWIDVHAGRSWLSADELSKWCSPVHCRSVGWLLTKKNGHVTIVPHLAGEKNRDIVVFGRGDLTIPLKMILKMTVLRH